MACIHCGHSEEEHQGGFFRPCQTCGLEPSTAGDPDEEQWICPDYEAEPDEE